MARIRTVKPELFRHEDLFDAELESGLPLRLAFIGLFTVADCEGRFAWKPRTLKLDVMPHDVVDFSRVLDALARHGFVRRYVVDGVTYGLIPTFVRHQRLQTKEVEAGSAFPQPLEEDLDLLGDGVKKDAYEAGSVPENSRMRTGTHPEAQEGEREEEEEEEEERGGAVGIFTSSRAHVDPAPPPENPHSPVAESPLPGPPPPVRPAMAGEVCKAIRGAGITQVNPSHPGLLALLAEGATAEEFVNAAGSCVAQGKLKFAYLLAAMRGMREDAARAAALPPRVRSPPGSRFDAGGNGFGGNGGFGNAGGGRSGGESGAAARARWYERMLAGGDGAAGAAFDCKDFSCV